MTPKDKQKKEKENKTNKRETVEQDIMKEEQDSLGVNDQNMVEDMKFAPLDQYNNGDSNDINKLIALKEEHYSRQEYGDAIILAEQIIRMARKNEKKDLVQEHEKFITKVHKDMKKKFANVNVEDIFRELSELKEKHEFNLRFEDAINVARKIIHIALVTKKKDVIVEQEEYIKDIKQKIKQKPSKLELVEKIEKLKGIKQEHVVKGEEAKAIEVARQIIEIAKIASIELVVEEEEKYIKSIKELWDKENFVSRAINDLKDQKSDYDILIKYNALKEAHQMIEDFSTKYQEYPEIFSDPYVKEFITEDNKKWVKYSVSTDKSGDEELGEAGRKKIVKLELEIVKIEEEKSRLRRELGKLKRKLEYSELGQLKLELDKKNAELEIFKKRLETQEQRFEEREENQKDNIEKEKQEIELNRAQLEEEKTRLKLEALKLEKSKNFEDDEKTFVQLEKTELEEERQRLTTEITRLMEDKEHLQREQMIFERDMEERERQLEEKTKKIEEKQTELNTEVRKFEEDKEKFEWDKLKLEEEKKKLEEDKQKVQEIKQKLMDL
ncbi:MAG: hypothetical protein JW891_05540 [Candidatus Lokiarchaeota archaeon]|nr:hypothetical protein [Candidatus Lokiarchaeota archaeon]